MMWAMRRKRTDELEALYRISGAMHTLDLEEVLHLILEGVTEALGFDRARLYLPEEEKWLVCRFTVGCDLEGQSVRIPIRPDAGIVALTYIQRRPYIVRDARNEPLADQSRVKLFKLKSFATAPLLGRQRVLGVISADNVTSKRRISDRDLEALSNLANQAGLALENAEMYERLRDFNAVLQAEVDRVRSELEEAQARLMMAEKLSALGRMAAAVAHEIRNPLTSIRILAHSIAERLEKGDEDLAVLEQEINRLDAILQEIVDFSRPPRARPRPTDTAALLRKICGLIEKEAAEKVTLELELPESLPKAVLDPDQIEQVMLNLLRNALEATPEGGTVAVGAEAGDGEVRIWVEDSGPGIPQELLPRVFDPFFTTKESGLGMGLATAHRIATEHGGTIEASRSGLGGARFTLRLPLGGRVGDE